MLIKEHLENIEKYKRENYFSNSTTPQITTAEILLHFLSILSRFFGFYLKINI